MDAVKKAADFFGMEEFYFFGRVGKGLSPRDLMAEAREQRPFRPGLTGAAFLPTPI